MTKFHNNQDSGDLNNVLGGLCISLKFFLEIINQILSGNYNRKPEWLIDDCTEVRIVPQVKKIYLQ